MSDNTNEERYCTYCHTFGHVNTDCPDVPMIHVTVDLFVPAYHENPSAYVRETSTFADDVEFNDCFGEDEPTYPNQADPELHASWREMVEFWEEEGTPSMSYSAWLRDQIETYEQIWRESARDRDRDSSEQYLQTLRREEDKFNSE